MGALAQPQGEVINSFNIVVRKTDEWRETSR